MAASCVPPLWATVLLNTEHHLLARQLGRNLTHHTDSRRVNPQAQVADEDSRVQLQMMSLQSTLWQEARSFMGSNLRKSLDVRPELTASCMDCDRCMDTASSQEQ